MYFEIRTNKAKPTSHTMSRLWHGVLFSTSAALAALSPAQAFDAVFELSSLDGSNGFVINDPVISTQVGSAVSNAGDVNGDGVSDVIIGARSSDFDGRSGAGVSYVIFGGTGAGSGGAFDLASINGSNGFSLGGATGGDNSGAAVGGHGDFNNDGFGDLLVGASSADPQGRTNAGESYVVFGGVGVGSGGDIDLATLNGSNGFTLIGVNPNDRSGSSVTSAGDLNGDGVDDFLVGAGNASRNGTGFVGETYVVFGGAGVGATGTIDLNGLNGSNGFVLTGLDESDGSARAISGLGDIDGDGFDDFVIGALRGDPGGRSNAGESYVIFGGANVGSSGAVDLAALNGTNGFTVDGIDPVDNSGVAVSGLGDFNGDGLADILISAHLGDPSGRQQAGEAYVVFGSTGIGAGGALELSGLNGSNGFVVEGPRQSERAGIAISDAGDVNGDGFADLIFGAPNALQDNDFNALGESYILFGGALVGSTGEFDLLGLDGDNGFVVRGADFGDSIGFSVSTAGDFNDDGVSDLLIGSRRIENGSLGFGEAYIVFGQSEVTETPLPASGLLLLLGCLLVRRKVSK